MKFGETLENEMVAAGLVGTKLPWIDYGCVGWLGPLFAKKEPFLCFFFFTSSPFSFFGAEPFFLLTSLPAPTHPLRSPRVCPSNLTSPDAPRHMSSGS